MALIFGGQWDGGAVIFSRFVWGTFFSPVKKMSAACVANSSKLVCLKFCRVACLPTCVAERSMKLLENAIQHHFLPLLNESCYSSLSHTQNLLPLLHFNIRWFREYLNNPLVCYEGRRRRNRTTRTWLANENFLPCPPSSSSSLHISRRISFSSLKSTCQVGRKSAVKVHLSLTNIKIGIQANNIFQIWQFPVLSLFLLFRKMKSPH